MKKIALNIIIVTLFISCNNKEKTKIINKNKNVEHKNTSTSKKVKEKDEKIYYFENEFRDLTNFDFNMDFPEFEKIYNQIKVKKNTIIKENLTAHCEGDACCTSKIFKINNETIKISKTDCGEYGFENFEFYYKDSVLKMYREFSLYVLEFPEESKETLWSIEETQYIFDNEKVCIRKRKRKTSNILKDNYRLNNEKYEIKNSTILELKEKLEVINRISEEIK